MLTSRQALSLRRPACFPELLAALVLLALLGWSDAAPAAQAKGASPARCRAACEAVPALRGLSLRQAEAAPESLSLLRQAARAGTALLVASVGKLPSADHAPTATCGSRG